MSLFMLMNVFISMLIQLIRKCQVLDNNYGAMARQVAASYTRSPIIHCTILGVVVVVVCFSYSFILLISCSLCHFTLMCVFFFLLLFLFLLVSLSLHNK